MKVIWITWEQQRRNKEIADAIPADYVEMSDTLKKHRLIRYMINTWRTIKLFWKEKPDVVISQNPSVVLTMLNVLSSKIFRFKSGVDAHNGALALEKNDSPLKKKVAKFLQKHADFTIVTNIALQVEVEKNGGHGFVLPDKIPSIKNNGKLPLAHKHNVLFICSFANDEPYDEVFKASKILDSDIGIYVTGNPRGRVNEDNLPTNVHLTGYLPWDDFDKMLYSVDAIIDLTTRENCLVCGAYEAVAVKKPLITSDTHVLKSYFSEGTFYTDNTAKSIAESIVNACNPIRNKVCISDMHQLNYKLKVDWSTRIQRLREMLI